MMSDQPPLPQFSQRLRAAMQEARVTPGNLARSLGVTATTVSRWLNGSRSPEVLQLRTIAKRLGKTAGYFVDDEVPIINVVALPDFTAAGSLPLSNEELARRTELLLRELIERLRTLPEP